MAISYCIPLNGELDAVGTGRFLMDVSWMELYRML